LIAFRKASVSPIEPRNPLNRAATVRPLRVAAITKKIAENNKAIVRRKETLDSSASMGDLPVVIRTSVSRARDALAACCLEWESQQSPEFVIVARTAIAVTTRRRDA
jgi:hypothetical protein